MIRKEFCPADSDPSPRQLENDRTLKESDNIEKEFILILSANYCNADGCISVNGKPVSQLKVDGLRNELETRGLKRSGLKKELQDRLYKHLEMEENPVDKDELPTGSRSGEPR